MNFIKKLLNINYRYRAITHEAVPVFADQFGTANKYSISIKRDDERFDFVQIESQGGEPVLFYKKFEGYCRKRYTHKGNPDFCKHGFTAGNVIQIDGLGYLGNKNFLGEVILVTDKYVYSRSMNTDLVVLYSYDELKRFQEADALTFLK